MVKPVGCKRYRRWFSIHLLPAGKFSINDVVSFFFFKSCWCGEHVYPLWKRFELEAILIGRHCSILWNKRRKKQKTKQKNVLMFPVVLWMLVWCLPTQFHKHISTSSPSPFFFCLHTQSSRWCHHQCITTTTKIIVPVHIVIVSLIYIFLMILFPCFCCGGFFYYNFFFLVDIRSISSVGQFVFITLPRSFFVCFLVGLGIFLLYFFWTQGDLHIDLHVRVRGQSNGPRLYLETLHIS